MDLAEPFAMSQPAISKHLKVLERAGLVSRGRDAQRRPVRLEAKPLAEANSWIQPYRQFWDSSFERLDLLLDQMKSERGKARTKTRPKSKQAKGK
jgi:DNA-binding transcriptional ArsR family regulator